MRKAVLASLAAALLAACSGPRPSGTAQPGQPSGPGAAVVFEKRAYKLVKTPDPELELALEGLLSGAYDAAVKKHSETSLADAGFTYSMAPKGAVYPFSEIEVSCIMREKYAARRGPELCGFFFTELDGRVKKALAGRQ